MSFTGKKHFYIYHDIENQSIHDVREGVTIHQSTINALMFQIFGEEVANINAHDITWWMPHCPEKQSAQSFCTPENVIDHFRTMGALVVNPGTKGGAVDLCLQNLLKRDTKLLALAPEEYRQNTVCAFITRDKDFSGAVREALQSGVHVAIVYDGDEYINQGLVGMFTGQEHHILPNWKQIKAGTWWDGLNERPTAPFAPEAAKNYNEERASSQPSSPVRKVPPQLPEEQPEEQPQDSQPLQVLKKKKNKAQPQPQPQPQQQQSQPQPQKPPSQKKVKHPSKNQSPGPDSNPPSPSPAKGGATEKKRKQSAARSEHSTTKTGPPGRASGENKGKKKEKKAPTVAAFGEFKRGQHSFLIPRGNHKAIIADPAFKAQCQKLKLRFFAYKQNSDIYRLVMTCDNPDDVNPGALKEQLAQQPLSFDAYSVYKMKLPASQTTCFLLNVDRKHKAADKQVEKLLSLELPENFHGVRNMAFSRVLHGAQAPAEIEETLSCAATNGAVVNFFPYAKDVDMDSKEITSAIRKMKKQLIKSLSSS